MGEVAQAVSDTKDPNWGLLPKVSAISDTKDPNWGLPPQKVSAPSDSGAFALRGAAAAAPTASTLAAEVATNPNVPKVMASAGRVIGGITPIAVGAAEGGPLGALAGSAAAAKGAWAGGKAGWFSGKLMQNVASPVARAAAALEPYAQAISTVSGAQGVLDLAQMADKTRQDIGFLGIGHSMTPDEQSAGMARAAQSQKNAAAEDQSKQEAWSAVVDKIKALSNALKSNGVPAPDAHAVKLVSDGNPTIFGRLMTLYMQSK